MGYPLNHPSQREMAIGFLNFLTDNGHCQGTPTKDTIHQIFTQEFRPQNRGDYPGCKNWSFGRVLAVWNRGNWVKKKETAPDTVFFTGKSTSNLPAFDASSPSDAAVSDGSRGRRNRSRRKGGAGLAVDQFLAFSKKEAEQIMQEIPSRPTAATPSSTSQGLPAGFTQESSNKFECKVCQKSMKGETDVTSHRKSHGHRVQSILLGIKKNK